MRVATGDFETDPFEAGADIAPFTWGFFDGVTYKTDRIETGADVAPLINSFMDAIAGFNGIIYFHNGGRFDFFFMLDYLPEHELLIINGRIAEIRIGKTKLRDSWLILPMGLAQMQKDDFDYDLMKAGVRDKPENAELIAKYLKNDCKYLYEWCDSLVTRFGSKLTLPQMAFAELRKSGYTIDKMTKEYDEAHRKYYFGGRVECFESGHLEGDWDYIDINSAYPRAMLEGHPMGPPSYTSINYDYESKENFFLISFIGLGGGALPFRTDSGLRFPTDNEPREYNCTCWELWTGLKHGVIDVQEVIEIKIWSESVSMADFINKFYEEKLSAERTKDKKGRMQAKLIMNSAYGKFATDPRKFKEYRLTELGDIPHGDDWQHLSDTVGERTIWCRPDEGETYYNVVTAASITGWVRAYMFDSLQQCERPVYCDTDSIICKSHSLPLGDGLGEWDLENQFTTLAIGGKKLYGGTLKDGSEVVRSKGARLTLDQIKTVASDGVVEWENNAPSFSLRHGMRYIKRKVANTV